MAFKADWWASCDSCHNSEFMDGSTLKKAQQTARKQGWSVSVRRVTCPDCRKKPTERKEQEREVVSEM